MGLHGERLGRCFRLENPATLLARTPCGNELAVTELRCDTSGFGLSETMAPHDAYLVTLSLTAVCHHESWRQGRMANAGPLSPGDICFHDLRRDPAVRFEDPFHLLAFYMPRDALSEIREVGEALRGRVGDPVVHGLGQSLLPCLSSRAAFNPSYVDHVLLALRSHLAVAYANCPRQVPRHRGGLAPWQHRRLQELLDAHLSENIGLERMARVCGLSPSGFLRAFKKAMGMAPQHWLRMRRIEHAQARMREGPTALSEIALSAGFADQSHFTRVFSQETGVSPGAWRRAQMALECGLTSS